jgi:hypothetical protein
MGTWGPGPFDNDSAAGLVARLMKPIRTVLKRKTNRSASYHYDEARAAAIFITIAHGTDILGGPDMREVLKLLERIRADERWLSCWRDPQKPARALDSEIRKVKRIIKTCCEPKEKKYDALMRRLARKRRKRGAP